MIEELFYNKVLFGVDNLSIHIPTISDLVSQVLDATCYHTQYVSGVWLNHPEGGLSA